MNALTRTHRQLIGVNFTLLCGLAVVTLVGANDSAAQPGAAGAGGRMRGDYTVVSGRMQGNTANAVWILDAANQELVALSWNRTSDQLEPIGYRSLTADERFQQRPR